MNGRNLMKLNKNFLVHQLDGEFVLVPTAKAPFHGLGQGNETVGVILSCLEKGASEEEIVDALADRFVGSREDMQEDVCSVIAKLRAIGAIDE